MNAFEKDAKATIDKLESELLNLDAMRVIIETKIKALKTFLYADAPNIEPNLQQVEKVKRAYKTRGSTTKDKVIEFAIGALSNGIAIDTAGLLEKMLAAGIEIGGADKKLSVSAILSRDDRFVASRKNGWTLKNEETSLHGGLNPQLSLEGATE